MKIKVKKENMECYFSGSLSVDNPIGHSDIADDIVKRMNTDGGVFTEGEADTFTLVTPVERREEFEDFLNTNWSDLDYHVMRVRKEGGNLIDNEGYEIADDSILDGNENEIVKGDYTVKDGYFVDMDGNPFH